MDELWHSNLSDRESNRYCKNQTSLHCTRTCTEDKRTSNLRLWFYTPSSELFKELNWQTLPERVKYQKAILMYRIINNICPDYLKNYVSYTSDILCRDTRSTNCNQLYTSKPNCELSASHSCSLELSSGILSPYIFTMQLRLTLLNLYI